MKGYILAREYQTGDNYLGTEAEWDTVYLDKDMALAEAHRRSEPAAELYYQRKKNFYLNRVKDAREQEVLSQAGLRPKREVMVPDKPVRDEVIRMFLEGDRSKWEILEGRWLVEEVEVIEGREA